MKPITVLTATGSRALAFSLCALWMSRQDYQGQVRWVIVDDGPERSRVPENDECKLPHNWRVDYVRPDPLWDGKTNTQARNLRAGLDVIGTDEWVVIVEDDDYYPPDWISTCAKNLERAPIFGETHARYYNIATGRHAVLANARHSSLCATAVRDEALVAFRAVCRDSIKFIDIMLWDASPFRVFREDCLDVPGVIGIKGLPGRSGIGVGHDKNFGDRRDRNGHTLAQWVGEQAKADYDRALQEIKDTKL